MSEYVKQSLSSGIPYDKIIPIKLDTYSHLLKELKKRKKTLRIPSNIIGLDKIITGFEAGRLYILSAPTKAGKTTMAQTLMHNLGKQDVRSMILSYEMGWEDIVEVFGNMDKQDNITTELPVYVPTLLHRGGGKLQFQWLFEAIAKAKEEKGVSFVVIDHLHFLLPLSDFKSVSFILGGIVREIKRIAVNLSVSIVLITHLQKIKDNKVPDWTDIRDSSFITQEADVVFMMYRLMNKHTARTQSDDTTLNKYTNKTIFSVELNRMGGQTGKIKLTHNGTKFVELSELDEFLEPVGASLENVIF